MFFWTLPKFAEGTRFQKHSIWRHVVAVQLLIGSMVGRLLSDRVWAFSTNIWLMCIERESLFLNQRLHSRLINPCKERTVLKDRAALNQGSCVSSPPSPLWLPGEQDGTVQSECLPSSRAPSAYWEERLSRVWRQSEELEQCTNGAGFLSLKAKEGNRL